jgi:hypothetical protein
MLRLQTSFGEHLVDSISIVQFDDVFFIPSVSSGYDCVTKCATNMQMHRELLNPVAKVHRLG